MNPILQVLVSVIGTLSAYGLFLVAQYVYWQLTSPLQTLPGPPNSSFMYGNSREIQDAENSVVHEKWVEEYGSTITYKWFFENRLYTLDAKALNHVLMNSYDYQKPEIIRWNLKNILGSGILVQEGDEHKLQRKVMNPAFGASQIRELTEIFVDESLHLRDVWMAQVGTDDKSARVDVLSWLSRMTLDVIGRSGFNYRFNALGSTEPDELNKAFSIIFGTSTRLTLWTMLQSFIPILRVFPTSNESTKKDARQTMDRIGQQLLQESKKHLMATGEKGNNWRAKDLLSLLVRSNMSKDIAPNQRMSDEDVIAQVPSFIVAGHETTSTATTWALYALTQHKEIQRKLREELLQVPTESPTMDILNSLPYLDAVVRETLRVHAPVPSTGRVAMKNDILPLATPFTDKNGVVHDGIPVRKGESIFIPILAMNRAKSLWGEDAREFNPERWMKPDGIPNSVSSIPGVWGNMMSFLGGPHACIGYRFSLVEMKALLFVLVRAFEFDLAVPKEDIISKTSIVQRPHLKSEPEKGSQLPLYIKPYIPS
ncbi:cytochrome P450 [Gymnopus androsaceus JB14]|uniref:Cytochrome P450 n=1 Tax=Gymnopus androsaceus JB14 TaxID=1447944 RepID=A0A6A4HHZ3_9AGAR|nr:cytochrome P450 [Gymnopus androsaceus JB14]